MPKPKPEYSPEMAKKTIVYALPQERPQLLVYIECGNQRETARRLNLDHSTVQKTVRRVYERYARDPNRDLVVDSPQFEPLPSKHGVYADLKEAAKKRAERKLAYDEAKRFRGIKFQDNLPIAVGFIGDPHVDDDGCDWTRLDHDTQIMRDAPGFYCTNMGDTTNNWVGRLARLYAHQETTSAQAWILAEGWLRELQDKWIILVRGNHDAWSGSSDPIAWMMSGHPAQEVYEWNVRVALEFPDCKDFRIWAAHNFKGHSQYHTLHGMIKARLWHRDPAEIYAAGHLHEWGHMSHEPTANRIVHYLRARGYKFADSYADELQFVQQQNGCTLTAVIDPVHATGSRRCSIFTDVEEAAEFLEFKRQRRRQF